MSTLVVETHVFEGQHVDHDPSRVDRVTAHAVPGSGDRHAKVLGTGSLQHRGKLAFRGAAIGGDGPDLSHGRCVQPARVIRDPRRQRRKLVHVAPGRDQQMGDRENQQCRGHQNHSEPDRPVPATKSVSWRHGGGVGKQEIRKVVPLL